ncbi:hypothetical protein SAMN05444166_1697 [Singulisphaera sp. GP187]|uniref:hypothetical protein n=1 Tax=Singulisphaera sp. GP187 TaxID=1882752 RepID=UPI00092C6119|nr:hypothetical protein [Singulisphaera sp. GP187]SIN93817.1 hypothetical protein SAMN05444166_1697 [Singulisphaera sp. GP187]
MWEREWTIRSHRPLTLRVADDGRPWVGLGDLLIEIDHDGRNLKTLDLARDDRERLGSFLLAPDGVYACLYRPGAPRTWGPRVLKLGPSGSVLWSTTLPIGAIGYTGVVEVGGGTGWEMKPKRPWQPETWEPIRYGGSEPLLLSGDRLLASLYEFPRSGIGCSYGLDAASGDLLWVTEPAPTSTLAVAGLGRFYHGLQGYGAFETRLLDHDGSVQRRWESHGFLVIDEQGRVRSLEMENRLPSRMRFVTLQDDGGVGNGPLLDGYYSSYPAISREGVVAFWRNGELVLIDDTMTKVVIYSDPLAAEQGLIGRMLLSPGGSLVFSVGYEADFAGEGLGSLAETHWPCCGGNVRNNPVWL